MRIFSFVVLSVLMVLSSGVFAASQNDPGPWRISILKLGEWINAPELSKQKEVIGHLYGKGKFKVSFRSGKKIKSYVIEAATLDWFSFKRTIGPGSVEVMVKELNNARFPHPQLKALVVVTNPEFVPSMDDFTQPLFMRVRNTGNKDARIFVHGVCQDRLHLFFRLGELSVDGFTRSGILNPGQTTKMLNLSRHIRDRSVLFFNPKNIKDGINAEISFSRDAAGKEPLRAFRLKETPAANETIVLYPQENGQIKFVSIAEIFARNLKTLEDIDSRRAVPKKIRIIASATDTGENIDTFRLELDLLRKVGVNGVGSLGRLDDEKNKLGFIYGWYQNFIPQAKDWKFNPLAAMNYLLRNINLAPKRVKSVTMMADEPLFREIPKSSELDKRFVEWMKLKGFTPKDAGVSDWSEVKAVSPVVSKKRLSVLSRDFQISEQISYWNGYGSMLKKINPNLEPTINWCAGEYYGTVTK